MMTPQDIREKTFEKAVFGGYDMGTVDDFLEETANDMALLQKENVVLKGKMKVLVDKIEEYRSNEDALRSAMLSVQKMANMIEKDAKDQSEKMINDAMAEASKITKEASLELDVEKAKLSQAKAASAQFIENMNLLCRKQMDFLSRLETADFVKDTVAASAPAEPSEIHETIKSIEQTVAQAANEPVSDVHPDIRNIVTDMSADGPTKAFNIVSSDEDGDDLEKTTQFSLDTLPTDK